jgi:hypothetical protein
MKLNLEFQDTMPDDVTPLEAAAMVKCLDQDGHITWYKISTPDLNLMETFGMLMSAVIVTGATVNENFLETEDEDGDGDE